MAKRISDLPELPLSDANDLIPIVDVSGNVTKRVTPAGMAQSVGENLPAASVGPSKRAGGFKMGVIPGATFGSNGNKVITGLGFRPKYVEFDVLVSSTSTSSIDGRGAMTETDQYYVATTAAGTSNARYSVTTRCIGHISSSGTVNMSAQYVSMDADGFTINVSVSDSTYGVMYKAFA